MRTRVERRRAGEAWTGRHARLAVLAATALLGAGPWAGAAAQGSERYAARLAATPRDTAMRAAIAGHGTAQAMLTGRALTVAGTFEGLKSRATRARLHRGIATGARGPAVVALEVSEADGSGSAGTIAGVVELDAETLAALEAGHIYIQLDSEGAPDGNLWGWLLRAAP